MPVQKRVIEAVAWILFAASLALAIADLFSGRWDHDSGMFFLHAAYITQGLKPYLDYSSIYPPLMEALTAIPVAIGGDRVTTVIEVSAFWILANTFATALVAFVITRDRVAALLAGAMFPLFAMQSWVKLLTLEYGVVFFALLAFAAASRRAFALAGVFFACAAMTKQPGAVAILPLLAIAWPPRREWMRFAAGLVLVPLVLLAWLRFQLPTIIRNVVHDLGTYAQVARVPGWSEEFLRSPDTIWLFVVTLVLGIALIAVNHRRWIVVTALAGAAIEFMPRLIRNYPHYNLNMWPFLALIFACAFERWRDEMRIMLTLFVALLAVSTAMHRVRTPSELFTAFAPAAKVVESVTPPGTPVRDYGAEPMIEFLARRNEERIDLGTSAIVTSWEEHYDTRPRKGTTIVIVDRGQPWVPRVVADVRSQGFRDVATAGRLPRVIVMR